MALTKVDVNMMEATGRTDAKFLKGDGTWAEAGGAATEMYTAATAPGSPVVGSRWYSTTASKAYVYSGTDWLEFAADFSATGGTETTYTGYKVHSFLADG